jgi:hypothetical protein
MKTVGRMTVRELEDVVARVIEEKLYDSLSLWSLWRERAGVRVGRSFAQNPG